MLQINSNNVYFSQINNRRQQKKYNFTFCAKEQKIAEQSEKLLKTATAGTIVSIALSWLNGLLQKRSDQEKDCKPIKSYVVEGFPAYILLNPSKNIENANKTITTKDDYSEQTNQYDEKGRVICSKTKTNHGITTYITEYDDNHVTRKTEFYRDCGSDNESLKSDKMYEYLEDGTVKCIVMKENDSQW